MSFTDKLKNKIYAVVGTAGNQVAAEREKAESDVAADPHVAGSRERGDGADGEYVGRTTADVDLDVGQTGAEARSKQSPRSD